MNLNPAHQATWQCEESVSTFWGGQRLKHKGLGDWARGKKG